MIKKIARSRSKLIRPEEGDRVLWIRLSALGDALECAASACAFQRRFPYVRQSLLTAPQNADVLRKQPYLEEVLTWDVKKRPFDFFRVLSQVRGRYEWLVSLHPIGSTALLSLLSGAPMRLGYNRSMQFAYTATHWKYFDMLHLDVSLCSEPALFSNEEDMAGAAGMLRTLPEKRLFAVIGATEAKRKWPVKNWRQFCSALTKKDWGIVLVGAGHEEEAAAHEISDGLPNVLDLVGKTSLPLALAVAKSCAAAMGNDTGTLHLAALAGTPALGLFGATDPWGANLRMPWLRALTVDCPKAGCWDYSCPVDCLAGISAERALDALDGMMNGTAGAAQEALS